MDSLNFTSWFLGPKAENAEFLEKMLLYLTRDYAHWRRNYFPSDKPLLSKQDQRKAADNYDHLESRLAELAARLRRNFPFYNPRYMAHQLSEVALPYFLGNFAGTLYNANNVTPEAAPVTVELEIQAANRILRLLGYQPPPKPPTSPKEEDDYERKLRSEFGWAHITSGGTAANIEALWVARNVCYFPFSAREAAQELDVNIAIKLPDGREKSIKRCSLKELANIKPNESIYLWGRLVEAVHKSSSVNIEEASALVLKHLDASRYALGGGIFAAAHQQPPAIFASGAAHYSIKKAANVLGLGAENVILVDTDSMFRIDIDDLRLKIEAAIRQGRVPLAVVSIAGTTEEGAVDPLHKIIDLRREFEKKGISFWVHVDAAWAGFFRSIFRPPKKEVMKRVLDRVGTLLKVPFDGNISGWHQQIFGTPEACAKPSEARKKEQLLSWLDSQATAERYGQYFKKLYESSKKHSELPTIEKLRKADLKITVADRRAILEDYVSETLPMEYGQYYKEIKIQYGYSDLISAFLAFPSADSITVDPHKMGYAGYPCGVVAFKNDRVRHFVMHRAPYITSQKLDNKVVLHRPPQHCDGFASFEPKVSVDAFAPFILEGSRPGATAAGLWLMTEVMPLNMHGHGEIVRASILAARELYEWLQHWEKINRANDKDSLFKFLSFTDYPPDTNIVIFSVTRKASRSLERLNRITDKVYETFSIQAELGEREYSYSQPFFLSRTRFEEPYYSFKGLEQFFAKADIRDARSEYSRRGISVLRATVMNPFLTPLRERKVQYLLRDFVEDLARASAEALKEISEDVS